VCWLTSGEDPFWAEPRSCRLLASVDGPPPHDRLLVLGIDPPAIGQGFGLGGTDIERIVVASAYVGDTIDPLPTLPVHVHLLLIRDEPNELPSVFAAEDLRLVSRGTLVESRAAAERMAESLGRGREYAS